MLASCAILLTAISLHVGNEREYNEVHTSLGLQCSELPKLGNVSGGVFKNSEGNTSFYIATRKGKDYWFEFGGATGYEAAPVVPIARVGYTFKYMEVFIGIGAEKIRDKVTPIGVFGTQLRIPIKEK